MVLIRFQARHPDTDEPIEVEAEYWPARRGSRDGEGNRLEPDEPAEVVIRTAWNAEGEAIPHRHHEEALILQCLWQRKLRRLRER